MLSDMNSGLTGELYSALAHDRKLPQRRLRPSRVLELTWQNPYIRSPTTLECGVAARQGRAASPAAIHTVRLVATDSVPPPTDGAADTPSYEKVPGGFIPTLPSPNSCLSPAELQQLRDLLHEFTDRFNDGSKPLPATSLLKAGLDTGDAQPISTPPRRLSPAMRQAVREAVAELDAQGTTEPRTGCWSTPIVMVRKASGAWRLCCDYRAINKHVRTPQQPLPRTDDILASFDGEKYFSVLDMCKGFYQSEIAEEDRPKTSFVTPDCQRQYRRLPFGFASSAAIFQRMVDLLLGGMKWLSAVRYIDDIIGTATPGTRTALTCGNFSRPCATLTNSCTRRSAPSVGRRSATWATLCRATVSSRASPKFRPFWRCPSLRPPRPSSASSANASTTAATRQKDFTWTPAADTAWRALCKALSSEPAPAHPDYTRPSYLDCDGSGDGLGAVLLQPYDEGERVVAYASRSLLDHERKWTATELEPAALIWAVETFRHYIDTIEVCIRPQQKHVDCLSRAPLPPTPTQRPIILDEFPSRTVLRARAEHPAPPALCILWCAPLCAAVNHVAHSAHRRMHLLRHRLRHMCAAAHAVGAPVRPTPSGSDDDTDVQVCLTDSDDDSPTPPTAQLPDNAPSNVIHGGRSIPHKPPMSPRLFVF
ncbi:hypothetical protein Emag_005256 [Eimeria magna]